MKMPFGRYKGQQIEDVPTEYLEWALRECDLDDEMVKEMEAQILMRRGEGVVRKRHEIE